MKKYIILSFLILLIISFKKEKPVVEIVDIPNTLKESTCYASTKKPLKPSPLLQLPLGSIQATGWLQTQLELMTEGYTGHLYEISSFLDDNSGWLGGDEQGWEEAPYWLRGFYDLSVLSENERIDSVANLWIEAVIISIFD